MEFDTTKLIEKMKKPPKAWDHTDFLQFLVETDQKIVKKALIRLKEDEEESNDTFRGSLISTKSLQIH